MLVSIESGLTPIDHFEVSVEGSTGNGRIKGMTAYTKTDIVGGIRTVLCADSGWFKGFIESVR
jgi:hypothetical protein